MKNARLNEKNRTMKKFYLSSSPVFVCGVLFVKTKIFQSVCLLAKETFLLSLSPDFFLFDSSRFGFIC